MQLKRTIIAYSVTAALAAVSGTAAASGFALIEQSASGLGNAYAGGAASAEDASTIFFNPAGMSRLQGKQIAVAVHGIKPSAKFSDTTSVAASLQTKGGAGGDAGSLALVPNGYFSMEINPQMRVGLGVNVPFGLQTEYDANWMGRFQAIKSKIETANLNPSASYQLNDNVSIGAGISYQRIKGDLSSAVNYAAGVFTAVGGGAAGLAAASAATAAGQGEGTTAISGDDADWGYNLGLLYKVSQQTRVGLAYRSTVKYNLSGTVGFSGNRPTAATLTPVLGAPTAAAVAAGVAAATADGAVNLEIKMPDTISASVFHQLNDKLDIMADATWTGWSVFQQLKVVRSSGAALLTVPENWRDTWRVSVGANHHYNEQWTARVGLAYDQSPVSDTYRTARIPDNDRTWLSLGGQYKPSKESAVDIGYAHLFVKDSSIADNQAAAGKGSLVGNYKNSVDILSAQYTRSF